jgi:phosphate transport system permease protein
MKVSFNKIEELFFYTVSAGAALIACLLLFMILAEITIRGIPSLTWYFISTPESMTPRIGMGIANAIWGSVIISLLAILLAIPLALGTAIYLQKYAAEGRLTRAFRFFIEVLSGTPAIVIGIFGLLVLVTYLRPFTGGFSLLSGSIALAILIVPVIERSIENAINAVSFELEEGSYALGATKWQTIRMITLPTAVSGIVTGAILGFGRAAEESAVVILTAGYSQFMPEFAIKPNPKLLFDIKIYPIQDLVGTLPCSVYHAYENSNVIKESNGFAAAVILISIVILVNFCAKIIITRAMPGKGLEGGSGGSWTDIMKAKIFPQKKEVEPVITPKPDEERTDDLMLSILSSDQKPGPAAPVSRLPKEWQLSVFSGFNTRPAAIRTADDITAGDPPHSNPFARIFLHTLLPFAIPTSLLGIIAFLATIPPLHHALGPGTPALAGLFGTGLALIITVGGLIFGLLLAKKGGAFRGKTRRIGYAGVAAGFCLVCIAGLICSSAAAGIFSTGTNPAPTASEDRNAKLAALLASGEPGSDQPDGSAVQVQAQPAVAPTSALQGNSTTGSNPRKNALSVGESYWYGDTQHTCRATIYDYKVLPFYFWWWIDYNRFVPQIPPAGQSYLVVFVRIENVGTQSAIIPSADRFNVSYNGYSSGRLPYLNTSLISTWQSSQLGAENRREQYYQWIREIGQDKRDYAYVTGENLFKSDNSTSWGNETTTATTSTTVNTTNTSAYNGAFLKPGRSQAVDGYLIFPVPDAATKDLNNTYVDVAFNSLSRARWKLG